MNLDNDYALKTESPYDMNFSQREAMVEGFGHYLSYTDSLYANKKSDQSQDRA